MKQFSDFQTSPLYCGVLKADDIIRRMRLDILTKKNPGGYRRKQWRPTRLYTTGSITSYITKSGPGLLSSPIFINIRKREARFKPQICTESCEIGRLKINHDEEFWIVDGERRLSALKALSERNDKYQKFPLQVVISYTTDRFWELLMHYIINSRHKQIDASLERRIFQNVLSVKGIDHIVKTYNIKTLEKAYTMEVGSILINEPTSVFHQRTSFSSTDNRKILVDYDKLLIQIEKIIKDEYFYGTPIRKIAQYVLIFWDSIAKRLPQCFDTPRDSLLFESPSIEAFTSIMIALMKQYIDEGVVLFEREVENTLDRIFSFSPRTLKPIHDNRITQYFFLRSRNNPTIDEVHVKHYDAFGLKVLFEHLWAFECLDDYTIKLMKKANPP